MSGEVRQGLREVVIVSAVRTPLCRARKGALAKVPPSTLLAAALEGCLARQVGTQKVSAAQVEDVCVGHVLGPPSNAAGFRMAQLSAGFTVDSSLQVTNRQCSSGLQAVANICNAIAVGSIDIGIGAGVESMSSNPMNKMRPPDVDWDVMKSLPKQTQAMDCLIPMGVTSENVSKKFGLKRETLDAFAAHSHHKASAAANAGKFRNEIVPVTIQTSEGTSIRINKDDGIRPQTTVEILGKLKPVFSKKGSTTAGNSSQTTDGAAAILCMTRQEAESRGLHILAVWKGFAVAGVPPAFMGMGPAVAIPKLLKKQRVSTNEVDVWEINEAFASQASWCISELDISPAKVNPNGGAIALGHALGCTGARMIATLVHEMERTHKKYGVVSMCIGTGMGAAALLENPNSSIRSNL